MRNRSLVLLGVMVIAFAAACQGAQQGGKPAKLTVAALQGDESLGLKAIASSCGTQIGTTIEFVDNPYDALYEKLVNTFQANDATYDLVMMDDPWMPKFGTDGSLPGPRPFGITRDPDIAQIVWDVGTWPPPHGAVPPSEKGKPAQLLGVTVVGQRRDVHVPQATCCLPPRPTTRCWRTRRPRTKPTSRATSSVGRPPTP